MCKALEDIRFCSCPENLDLSQSKEKTHYIWIMNRVIGLDTTGVMGLTMLPKDKLDDLIPEFIVQELNSKNLFDFEYEPQENDDIRIERIDRHKTRKNEYLFGEYLSFHFFCGEWHIGQTNPFMYHSKIHKNGKVKITKINDAK
ncbi:hypothetical protein [Kordia sp.]|uniref:hypothetical protein n=1 Tax=Kordia sp. TaxID=1965332 RepID=UPI003B5B630E